MRTISAIIEHNASFQQAAPVSAVDLLSGYEPGDRGADDPCELRTAA
jgi:hypothetical protein